MYKLLISSIICCFSLTAISQNIQEMLQQKDISEYRISKDFVSKHNQVRHVYVQQMHQNIPVFNSISSFALQNGAVFHSAFRAVPRIAQKVNTSLPILSASAACKAAATHLNIPIETQNMKLELVYLPLPEGNVKLCYNVNWELQDKSHWWQIRIDAQNGTVYEKNDWVSHCDFGHQHRPNETCHHQNHSQKITSNKNTALPNQYLVYSLPSESPFHGTLNLLTDPASPVASPFGWHDTDGNPGPEFTYARGNNVNAYEDADDDNQPGYSPDGGANLEFIFNQDYDAPVADYEDMAITNLFYMNNMMHDISYAYGFDEVSGNFQDINYTGQGQDSDAVNAEARDGSGTNNANFSTPPDGGNPRMQMYLWDQLPPSDKFLTIHSPASISGNYFGATASFGPQPSETPLTADAIMVDDAAGINPNDACEAIINDLSNKIAIIDQTADCFPTQQALNAQDAGAVGVIVIKNSAGPPIGMGGSGLIVIPCIMVSQEVGNNIKAELSNGPVNLSIVHITPPNYQHDAGLDNGIIAHEYGHGISNRLTGGGNSADCLYNEEQMGEGWSDFFSVMYTMDMNATLPHRRPIGTFSQGQDINGLGIRPAPYDTSMLSNPYTYGDTNDEFLTVPHGIGFVWCTMLWDLNWAMINLYGFDADVINGTGGNNKTIQLVMDGMKMQPCSPGFVDGRDAILAADQALYNGIHRCLIWEVFARRGLGYSADQGSSNSRSDQLEAFDLPPVCLVPVVAPNAAFTPSSAFSCDGFFAFNEQSTDIPLSWFWDFGDGDTSLLQEPVHTYSQMGTYEVMLIASNTIGSDTTYQTIEFGSMTAPTGLISNATVCEGEQALFSAESDNDIWWLDEAGNFLAIGDTFISPALSNDVSFQAVNALGIPPSNIGPEDGSVGTGGYHGTTFTGTVDFTCEDRLFINSAWVDADGSGLRTFNLWDNESGNGNIIQTVSVMVPDGQSRIQLNFEVPGPGTYSIGGTGVDLFRNDINPGYPFEIEGLMRITGSSAGSAYYYYLYDLEVMPFPCMSSSIPVNATVKSASFTYSANELEVQFNESSSSANSYSYYFGDGTSSTEANPLHTYAESGTYTVELSINGGECSSTQTIIVSINSSVSDVNMFEAKLVPNPVRETSQLIFNQALKEEKKLEVWTVDGKLFSSRNLVVGSTTAIVELKRGASGVYYVKLFGAGELPMFWQLVKLE